MNQSAVTIAIVTLVFVFDVEPAQSSSAQGFHASAIRHIDVAIDSHFDLYKRLPGDVLDKQGKPLLSWRVKVLGFIDEVRRYEKLRLDEPWDSPHNHVLLKDTLSPFRLVWQNNDDGRTVIGMPRGRQTFFGRHGGRQRSEVADSWRHTIRLVEYDLPHAPFWSEPAEIDYDPRRPHAGLGSRWRLGFFREPACFATAVDGTLCFIPQSLDPQLLHALFTIDGGEPVEDLPWYATLTLPRIGPVLSGCVVISLFFVGGSIPVVWRVLRGELIAPGEVLWLLIAAQQIAFFIGLTLFYRYEALPSFRPQEIRFPLWFAPRLVGFGVMALVAITAIGAPRGWRAFFVVAALYWALVADFARPWHALWWPEEAMVTIAGPLASALTALAMMFRTWSLPDDAANLNDRPRAHWIGITAAWIPLVWFGIWCFAGFVFPRTIFISYVAE